MGSTEITDQFQDLDIIGRGSFGLIRKVLHKGTGRTFVRKEISYHSMSKKEEKQLASEFEILQKLDHPNIVHVYGFDKLQNEKLLHIYMEYCDGGDVSQLIKKYCENKQYIPETLIWQIFTQTLLALYRCHYGINIESANSLFKSTPEIKPPEIPGAQVVIHRDIKPENIFFMSDNYTVKLGDFGLAKCLAPHTHFTQTYVGTPYYMPPEVISEKAYNTLCDVWSLGCVIYELCALTPPFTAKSHTQLQERIKLGNYNQLPAHYSNRLKMCIYACLITEPTERADVNLLLQETSVKIYRREWELNQKELEITRREIEIKRKEQQITRLQDDVILREKQIIKVEKALDEERQKMITQHDESTKQMKTEFKAILETSLNRILSELPPDVQLMLQSKSKENRPPSHHQNYMNTPVSLNKIKGPRFYEDDYFRPKR
jgi:NIMA (never in mitosis gene a)-related kinase